MSNRSMVKVLLADDFFPHGEAQKYANIVRGLQYERIDNGYEIPNFNMLLPDVEQLLSTVIGEDVDLIREKSGTFRKPLANIVQFESFTSLREWCFVVALERTTFNLYYHIDNTNGCGEAGTVDARNALEAGEKLREYKYRNFFEWNIDVNIELQPNQGVFFRPWMFHTFNEGLVHYYRCVAKE